MRRDDSSDGAAPRPHDVRLMLRLGRRAGVEATATAGGLRAIGVLVSAILLSTAVVVRAARDERVEP